MQNKILISTFDKNGSSAKNQFYTSIVSPGVNAVIIPNLLNIYSLLGLIEENWNLGTLGINDATAAQIPNIWKKCQS